MSDNRRVYSCKKCKQTFKQKPAYQQHKLSHGIDPGEDDSPDDGDDKGDEKPFTCNLCSGAQFKRKSSLVKHKIVDHGETVTCDHCPLQFEGCTEIHIHHPFRCIMMECNLAHLFQPSQFQLPGGFCKAPNMPSQLVPSNLGGCFWGFLVTADMLQQRLHSIFFRR